MKTVPFFKPSITQREEEAVLKVLRSGWLTTGGETLAFEKEFAEFVGSKNALAVNSCSSGLILALKACGIGKGTSVLTSPYTFASTALAAVHLGANLVYADISEEDYSIDPKQIERLLENDKTIKAIIPIHIAGKVCDLDAIMTIAKKHKVRVIEDAAHAFPAPTQAGYAGTLGDIGVYSFYTTKTITTCEGGMVVTNDDQLAERMRTFRMHGINRSVWDRYTDTKASWKYDVVEAGWKFNLPDILSAIGRVQLSRANELYEERKAIAKRFTAAFSGNDAIVCPPDGDGNAWHLYLLRINPEALKVGRDEVIQLLQERGLGMSMHFIPHFKMTYFKKAFNLKEKDYPNALKKYETSMTLPFWPGMSDEQIEYVIDTVLTTIESVKR